VLVLVLVLVRASREARWELSPQGYLTLRSTPHRTRQALQQTGW
jgi:hypothetical protein